MITRGIKAMAQSRYFTVSAITLYQYTEKLLLMFLNDENNTDPSLPAITDSVTATIQ
jgi:hypothetical protein